MPSWTAGNHSDDLCTSMTSSLPVTKGDRFHGRCKSRICDTGAVVVPVEIAPPPSASRCHPGSAPPDPEWRAGYCGHKWAYPHGPSPVSTPCRHSWVTPVGCMYMRWSFATVMPLKECPRPRTFTRLPDPAAFLTVTATSSTLPGGKDVNGDGSLIACQFSQKRS
jgi:hypothetical protein